MKDYTSLLASFKQEFADEFRERVSARTPVDSGNLQKSWDAAVLRDSIEISNGARYAAYIEYGTVHIPPVGMLRTTVLEAEDIARTAAERVGL